MSPFQVPEGPYTIEQIMESIRAQIINPARTAAPESGVTDRAVVSDSGSAGRLLAQLELMRQRQVLDPGYRIQSHRPVIGRLLDLFKRLIHWGARPYVDAIRTQQETYNAAVLQAFREVSVQFGEIGRRLVELDRLSHQLHREQSARFDESVQLLHAQHGELTQALQGCTNILQNQEKTLQQQDESLQRLHARHDLRPFFEELSPERRRELFVKTRGPYDEIEGRQWVYVPLFQNRPGRILDVGCGRGELLYLLRRHGINCYGADPDPAMLETVRSNGTFALQTDALSALRAAEPRSLGGVFAAQVIEHFFPGELMSFLRLAQERLAEGGLLVLESLNPAALGVLAKSYYRDLDHKQPIHPDYLKLLLETMGFAEVEVHYLMPFSEEERLPDLALAEELGIPEPARAALQELIDRLNSEIYGLQDYYITALKGTPSLAVETSATQEGLAVS